MVTKQDLLDGLVGYWKVDETTGTTGKDEVGTLDFDLTGWTINQNGKIGRSIAHSTGNGFDTGHSFFGDDWSIGMWIKYADTSAIMFFTNNYGTTSLARFQANAAGQGSYRYVNFGNTVFSATTVSSRNEPGEWIHLVVTKSGSTLTLYYNGQSIASGSTGTNRGGRPTFFRSDSTNVTGTEMDEAFSYDRALNSTEVSALYDIQKDGFTNGSYPFDALGIVSPFPSFRRRTT